MQQPVIQTHTTHHPDILGSGQANLIPPESHLFWMPPTNDKIHHTNKAVADENNLELYGDVRFVVSTYKYAIPIVAGILIIPTAGFMYVMCKQMRTATTMNRASCSLMVAIAVADILCIAVSIPEFGYMYSVSRTNHGYLPLSSCSTMSVLERLSAIPHTASIWLTVALSVQRYLCVAKPFIAKSHFTTAKSAIIITFAYTLAIIMHVCRFFDVHFVAIGLRINSFSNLSEIVETCQIQYASWIQQPVLYEALFSWCRFSFVQLIPCALLIVFTLGLTRALSVSNKSLKAMKIVDSNREKQRRSLSIVVLLTAGIVCAVESSMGIILCLNSIRISTGINFVSYETVKMALVGIDIVVYFSYFFIFSIYCLMSHGIRDKVRNMVCNIIGKCTNRNTSPLSRQRL
ncbi:MAG: 7 transmembrane receptor [Sedimenticola sp.]